MKIIFMGTPDFAVEIVRNIALEHEVVLVVTQPDVYNYKKKVMAFSPVKEWALANNIEVFQPEKIRLDYQKILETKADLIVTAAYGQIIGKEVLDYPKYKCINVHGSILPKYRGGAPIQRAIMNGDKETGITIMYMGEKMDNGDILDIKRIVIEDSDNQESLFRKLAILGGLMINPLINKLEKGLVNPIKQNEDEVTFAYNLKKEDEHIDFSKEARDVFNQIRALNANPGGYFLLDNLCVKVYNSIVSEKKHNTTLGLIIGINKDSFDVSCANGTVISILEIQLPSKNRMKVKDFINGQGKKLLEINKEIK